MGWCRGSCRREALASPIGTGAPTSTGAVPTPVTATSWPPNARNAPASEAREASAGADAPSTPQPDSTWRTYAATALDVDEDLS